MVWLVWWSHPHIALTLMDGIIEQVKLLPFFMGKKCIHKTTIMPAHQSKFETQKMKIDSCHHAEYKGKHQAIKFMTNIASNLTKPDPTLVPFGTDSSRFDPLAQFPSRALKPETRNQPKGFLPTNKRCGNPNSSILAMCPNKR
jgi:hypothetical protein